MIYITNCELIEKYFLETGETYSKMKQKIVFYFRKLTKKIYCKKFDDKNYELISCENNDMLYKTKIKKIEKNLLKIIKKLGQNNIVLSKEIQENEQIKNLLYANQLNILDGRELFKEIIIKTVEKICSIKKKKIQKQEISILINEPDKAFTHILKELVEKAKIINIVTNDITQFESLEKQIYDEVGVLINVSNNMKKVLQKSSIIINYNFPLELLSKCNFPRLAVIVNVEQKIKIYSIKFQGININDYEIEFNNNQYEFLKNMHSFENKILYESLIYEQLEKGKFQECREKIEKDKIKIIHFFGNNGIISKKEFQSLVLRESKSENAKTFKENESV